MSTQSTDRTALMRVRVALTVEVDPDAWAEVYGQGGETQNAIRADVREYARRQIAESAAAQEGAIKGVEWS